MKCAVALLLATSLWGQFPAPQSCRETLPHLEAAHRLDPKNVDVLAGLLHCQLELRQQARAEQSYQQLEALLRGRDPRLLELGALLARQEAYPLAIRAFQKILRADPSSYDAAYNLGLAFLLSEDTRNAEAVLTRLVARRETGEAQNLLGRVYEKSGDAAQALRHYQRAIDLDPGNEDFWFDHGLLVMAQDRKKFGVDQLATAVRDFPKSPRMWAALGAANYLKGDNGRCYEALMHARQLAPDFEQTYYYLGRLYSKATPDVQKEIKTILRERIAAHPDDAWAHYFYGTELADEQQELDTPDYSEAETHLRASIRLDPLLAEAHLRLGLIYNALGKLVESVSEFERAVHANPAMAEPHYRLGLAYAKLGKPEAAAREFALHEKLRGGPTDEHGKRRIQMMPMRQ